MHCKEDGLVLTKNDELFDQAPMLVPLHAYAVSHIIEGTAQVPHGESLKSAMACLIERV